MEQAPKTLILTGGGTAGHVIPNLALVPLLEREGWRAEYVGSAAGIEKRLAEERGLPFHAISTGKLRRYLDFKNFTDPFRVVAGVFQAWSLLGRLRPRLVFSKGGFVAVPVVLAARLRGIPVILHESDLTPGLANRLCIPFARVVCASFPATLDALPKGKAVLTGAPIRAELFRGDRLRGREFLGFPEADKRPVLLVMGGSLGSRALNRAVRGALAALSQRFAVAHICGKDGLDAALDGHAGYRQFEFIGRELPDVLAACDFILSRAGANAIFEFLALQKPNLLVPLSKAASRGDQILNAENFAAQGFSRVLPEEELSPERLARELAALEAEAETRRGAMAKSGLLNGAEKVVEQIRKLAGS